MTEGTLVMAAMTDPRTLTYQPSRPKTCFNFQHFMTNSPGFHERPYPPSVLRRPHLATTIALSHPQATSQILGCHQLRSAGGEPVKIIPSLPVLSESRSQETTCFCRLYVYLHVSIEPGRLSWEKG